MSRPRDIVIRRQSPPGQIVAPLGFPADPRPVDAPKTFLDAMEIRIKVFCGEQKCALEPELDEDDPRSWTWVLYYLSHDTGKELPMSTVRIVPPPHPPHPNGFYDGREKPYVKLTRVATVKEGRQRGLNTTLINFAFDGLASHPELVGRGWDGLVLTHAQVAVESMYHKLGFETDEKLGRWKEEGIMHVGMWKQLKVRQSM